MVAAFASCPGVHIHLSFRSQGIRAGKGERRRPKEGGQQQRGRGDLAGHVGWVLRQDKEFLARILEPAAAPFRRLARRVSKALDYFFWLRFLEKEDAAQWTPPSWPSPSYSGLSGMDLLFADTEAVKSYANYPLNVLGAFAIPLPETYDSKTIDYYFKCRPHILAARIFEMLFSFGTAAVQIRISRDMFIDHYIDEYDDADPSQYITGKLLRDTMLNLGPTFIKVGQSLSTRPDIIGSGIAKALSELHDRVPPFPRSIAMKIIEDDLGCPVEHLFSYISDKTVAAASFGQVYRGRTCDGYDVAIKVQRPDLLHAVHLDIYILRLGLGIFQKSAKRKSDPRLYADELGKGFVGELNYLLEASNAIEFKEAHAKYPFIAVPNVFKKLTRKRVLTMEWLVGENPRDLLSSSKRWVRGRAKSDVNQLDARRRILDFVNIGVEATLVQLLDSGILHADPHPGNLLYTPEGKLGFLDFGLLSRMQQKHKVAMLAAIVHIVNGDWAALVQDLAEMDVVPPTANTQRFTMDLEEALGVVAIKDGIPDVKFSKVLGKIWSIAYGYNFRMPPYFILILRSLASFEGLAVASDQDFKSFQAAYPFVVQKLLLDNSAASRKILYSVIFNKRREFQWQRISLFLNLSSSRKSKVTSLTNGTSPSDIHHKDSISDALLLILKLLSSNDGVVLRRILMDGDASSLARAVVSDEAIGVRRYVSRALADVIYRWMTDAIARRGILIKYDGSLEVDAHYTFSQAFPPLFEAMIRDRRVKVILHRLISIVRHNPILMIRLFWEAVLVSLSSSALALHRLFANFSDKCVKSYLSSSKKLSSLTA